MAEVTERQTVKVLAPLAAVGHHLLADGRWPGSRRAQVDLVVVGPGGVFIVDTKAWKDVSVDAGRISRGQEDVTDDVLNLADLAYTAKGDFAEAPGEVRRPVVVLAGRKGIDQCVGPVRIVGEHDILRHIASYGTRLTAVQVDTVLARTARRRASHRGGCRARNRGAPLRRRPEELLRREAGDPRELGSLAAAALLLEPVRYCSLATARWGVPLDGMCKFDCAKYAGRSATAGVRRRERGARDPARRLGTVASKIRCATHHANIDQDLGEHEPR